MGAIAFLSISNWFIYLVCWNAGWRIYIAYEHYIMAYSGPDDAEFIFQPLNSLFKRNFQANRIFNPYLYYRKTKNLY